MMEVIDGGLFAASEICEVIELMMENRDGGEGRCLYTLSDGRTMLTVVKVPLSSAAGLEASLCGKVMVRITGRYNPFLSVDLIE